MPLAAQAGPCRSRFLFVFAVIEAARLRTNQSPISAALLLIASASSGGCPLEGRRSSRAPSLLALGKLPSFLFVHQWKRPHRSARGIQLAEQNKIEGFNLLVTTLS